VNPDSAVKMGVSDLFNGRCGLGGRSMESDRFSNPIHLQGVRRPPLARRNQVSIAASKVKTGMCMAGVTILAVLLAFGAGAAPVKSTPGKSAAKKTAPAKAKPKLDANGMTEEDAKLWALRDHYRFGSDNGQIYYAVENAEWTLDMPGAGHVIENAGFRIVFADGSTWNGQTLGKAESLRESFSDDWGHGTVFTSQFPAKDGLVVRHSMSIYKDRPFILVRLALGNTGDNPVEIKSLAPAVLGPAGIGKLSAETKVAARRIRISGGYAVFDKSAPSVLNIFEDPARKFCLSFGVVPGGIAESNAEVSRGADGWQGEVVCVYSPSIRLESGQKLSSDPVWLTYRTASPAEVDQNYAWVASRMPHAEMHKELPRAWISAEKGDPESKLIETVKAWGGSGVKYALVPEHWEGRPGSMEGCTPAYPKDMSKTAKALAGLGMQPGLTLDPLMTAGGSDDWAFTASDGVRWINLSHPDGRKHAVGRLKKAVAWGYRFFAVPPSNIPDEALRRFNLTRAQAAALAMQIMQEAAEGHPVAASSACALPAALDAWLEAAAATGRMTEFGVSPGAVRLVSSDGTPVEDALAAALVLFSSPIECTGKPSQGVIKALSQAVETGRVYARPVDASQTGPKLWMTAIAGAQEGVETHSVIAFPGAPAWKLADLLLEKTDEKMVWHATDGKDEDPGNAISNGNDLTVYGVSAKPGYPALLGASAGPCLLFDDLKQVAWKDDKNILTALFEGKNKVKATAYIEIPEGYTLKSGKVGETPVARKNTGSRLALPIEPGRPTRIELEFSKK